MDKSNKFVCQKKIFLSQEKKGDKMKRLAECSTSQICVFFCLFCIGEKHMLHIGVCKEGMVLQFHYFAFGDIAFNVFYFLGAE